MLTRLFEHFNLVVVKDKPKGDIYNYTGKYE